MEFSNVYGDSARAEAYAKLEFPGTYYLAYRDLPEILSEHVDGKKAIDFGCGAGRSTRFLKKLGFETTGVDISENMIKKAGGFDPEGDYRLIKEGSLNRFEEKTYNLVLSAFTFDNIPTLEKKTGIFRGIGKLLSQDGKIINLVSTPEIYVNEWASFTTKDFPENRSAKSGDKVRIVMKDVDDKRPVIDVVMSDEDYREIYRKAGLEVVKTYYPLAEKDEPFAWINETRIAPWVIYVLERNGK